MAKYLVNWGVELDAGSPEDAAKKAWKMLRLKDSIANVFEVVSEDGSEVEIDLEALKIRKALRAE